MRVSNYLFVVGCPRSGTTLLSVLLDRHTRLCVPPETAFFDEVAPRLWRADDGRLLHILRRWRRLAELSLEPEAVLGQLGSQERTASQILAAILDLYAQAHDKVRCGEKTPQHLMHVPRIMQQFPGAKVVCVLRDGREAALSMISMPWWRGSLATAANLWKKYVYLAEKFTTDYPAHFKIVRYEDIVARPEEMLPFVMEYLGEEFECGQLWPEIPSGVVLPRSSEWKGCALRAIDAGYIARRRNGASQQQIAFLERVLSKELRRNGYAI